METEGRRDGTAQNPQSGPGLFVAASFLAAALLLVIAGNTTRDAIPDLGGTAEFDRAQLSFASPRIPLSEGKIEIAGFERSCEDCHALFEPGERAAAARGDTEKVQHGDIVLAHGKNDRCLSCHHPEDRNSLALLDGTTLPFAAAEKLCRECHGLVGRDWEAGTHGRTHGSWRTGSPEQRRLSCTECHDPHSPAFPNFALLPGPNTLRLPPLEERNQHSAEPRWPRSAIEAARGAQK